ncbi:hypothetical protein [Bradyrhizobium symbiodeficiens]|uniref:hypothetical protein n=1 Tax=Bradyrhizobium symbiodeficiens TaxID=1404367 RepID=UPI00140FB657|nr:hypothetical protein [Bradyrhizobium symbiodeficiens]QIO98781.1 hypothetical protein HAU86_02680 [Bradyrhizobium symbiodeficiens]
MRLRAIQTRQAASCGFLARKPDEDAMSGGIDKISSRSGVPMNKHLGLLKAPALKKLGPEFALTNRTPQHGQRFK